jgi:diphthine-ammonia ligase
MPSSLNVVALVSGGKDSLYSIIHCIQNGHNVVALANLYPLSVEEANSIASVPGNRRGEGDDLNSFMYQTVGHSVIPLYASALNLPLYRCAISGTATQVGKDYRYRPAGPPDETEDLIPLLQEVKRHHVEVNAICSGAILSTYQRTRIESIALRMGLTPLAFLWQYPALPPPSERDDSITGLLDDMAAAGCDCRIIKTASGGLKDSMLWANITSPRTRNQLVVAMSPFFEDNEYWLRGAVLGEGGEYETLTINGPSRIWKRRIVIEADASTIVPGEGGTSHLRLGNATLVEQELTDDEATRLVRIPEIYDPAFVTLENEVASASTPSIQCVVERTEPLRLPPLHSTNFQAPGSPYLKMSMSSTRKSIVISNITTTEYYGAPHKSRHIMQLLQTCIHSLNLKLPSSAQFSLDDIVFTTLLLESMTDFAAVNEEYGKLFTAPNPPARVTIACGHSLPGNLQISLSVVLDTGPRGNRRGLHVQSRSYWAPANIGPYSQAISVPYSGTEEVTKLENGEIVHVAGQIPLMPHTMETSEGTFLQQTILSLQHLWRVGQERGVDLWTHGVAFLAKVSSFNTVDSERLQTVWRTWKGAHAWSQKTHPVEGADEGEEGGPDAWDLRHNPYHHHRINTTQARRPSGTHLHPLPRLSVIQASSLTAATIGHTYTPPLLIAEVDSLPKSAPIEWHGLGLGSMPTTHPRIRITTADAQYVFKSHCTVLADDPGQGSSRRGDEPGAKARDSPTTTSMETDFVTVQVYNPEGVPADFTEHATESVSRILSRVSKLVDPNTRAVAQGTAFVGGRSGWTILRSLQQTPGWECLTTIPCRAVWGAATESGDHTRRLSLGLVLRLERL